MRAAPLLILFFFLTTIVCDTSINLNNLGSTLDAINYSTDLLSCVSKINPESSSVCTSVETRSTGVLSNQCCYIEYTLDMSRIYKLIFGNDWDSSDGDNELETKMCFNLYEQESSKNTELYTLALSSTDKEVLYNCGSDSVTFKTSDYNPKTEAEKIGKEIADCTVNTEKNKCLRNAEDFETNVQCCWFSMIVDGEDDDDYTLSSCIGVQDVALEYFNNVETEMTKIKNKANKFGVDYKFTCTNKKGKSATGTYKYKLGSGSLNIESNEQNYSNLIGLKIFSILLIGLLI